MITTAVLELARKLWDYHHVNHVIKKSDCILALGSHDLRVAERAAELYLDGLAGIVIFSGGLGRLTENMWTQPEADLFADIAKQKGVPEKVILIENKSTNTGENILFTSKLLKENKLNPHSFILVQKPYMERRSYATFKKQWPDKEVSVTSPQIKFEDYPNNEIPMEQVINIMVGDLQRIITYPGKGFQIYQEVPADVLTAYNDLVRLGYNQQIFQE